MCLYLCLVSHTTLVQDFDSGGGCAYLGSEGKPLYLLLDFVMTLKTALKIKVCQKEKVVGGVGSEKEEGRKEGKQEEREKKVVSLVDFYFNLLKSNIIKYI